MRPRPGRLARERGRVSAVGHSLVLDGLDRTGTQPDGSFKAVCLCGWSVVKAHAEAATAEHVEHAVLAPGLQDWCRVTTVFADEGIIELVDGRVNRHREAEAVRLAWHETWGDKILSRTLPDDPVGMQQAAAVTARIARENPGGLVRWALIGWQRHAQHVAECSRAEMCRVWGGTGAERAIIEQFEVTFPQAVVIAEHLARLQAGLPGLTEADGPS